MWSAVLLFRISPYRHPNLSQDGRLLLSVGSFDGSTLYMLDAVKVYGSFVLFIALAGGSSWDKIPKDKSLPHLQFSDYICRDVKAIAETCRNLNQKARHLGAEIRGRKIKRRNPYCDCYPVIVFLLLYMAQSMPKHFTCLLYFYVLRLRLRTGV